MQTTHKKLNLFLIAFSLLAVHLVWSQSEAFYNITVTTTWNSSEHSSVPTGAHWSDLIGATHSTPDRFMSLGNLATSGIQNVAESGNNTAFRDEINDAINIDGNADQMLEDTFGFTPFGPIGTSGFTNVAISEDFPLISLVSMVAPSPDWFIAVNSLNLRSGDAGMLNGWKDDFVMDVYAYDSGTDDGMDYTSANSPNGPVPIFMITGAPINGNKIGTITFDYLSSTLGVENAALLMNVKIYPNPVNDILHITNSANTIEDVELYNVLGKRIHSFEALGNGDLVMNVKNFEGGIYILKIYNAKGESLNRKIIID